MNHLSRYELEFPHPIFKWAGGKTSLLKTFDSNNLIPESFGRYYEPFFGAGALYFHLWSKGLVKKATLSDINDELYNVYSLIKKDYNSLITFSKDLDLDPNEKVYYLNRAKFNKLKSIPLEKCSHDQKLERAVLMIYLNKTCYSGMYRENRKGEFNVPCGKYNKPTILDDYNLYEVSKALKNVSLRNEDYKTIFKNPRKNDFVYLDPPYMPYGEVSHFRDYHRTGFDNTEQEKLCEMYKKLNNRQCKIMLSNSSSPKLNDMYESIPGVSIKTVSALRLINQKNIGRAFVNEYVIINYPTKPY